MMQGVRDEPLAAFMQAVKRLEAAGAVIDRIEVPAVQQALDISGPLITVEAYGLWMDVIEAASEKMYAEILRRFRLGRDHSGPTYVAAWAKLEAARAAYDVAISGYDAVLAPTSASLPPSLERLNTDHDYYVTENLLALRNTRIGNLLGLCALTLPTGAPGCGLMLMAAPDLDSALLRLGAAAEAALA
jgi:aspartyl-tRNA(Asn)/glutamyl-tRNA(Gln) amidotransferase subunit A